MKIRKISTAKKSYGEYGYRPWRINLIAAIFIGLFGFVVAKLFEFQVIGYQHISAQAIDQRMEEYVIHAKRGDILASDGLPLAHNVTLNLIYANAREIVEKDMTAAALAPVLGLPVEEIRPKLDKDSAYVPLLNYAEAEVAASVVNLKLKGIYRLDQEKRTYPEGGMLAQVIGYVNRDGQGQYGLEQYYNGELSGKEGYRKRERDTSGRPIPIGINEETEPVDGRHLVLTIDRSVQRIVEEKLKAAIERTSASSGSVIVMDPPTGEILAMASYPSFDPNNYTDVLYDEAGAYIEGAYNIYNNQVVSNGYEPGSVFKVVTMAAALDSGAFQYDDILFDSGEMQIGGWTIKNWDRQSHGSLTLTRCLELSNNVCLAQLSRGVGSADFYRYLQGFGFGAELGIDLASEAPGQIHPLSRWGDILTATSGYGQGITVTPIQMATAVSAIANRGRMVQPYVVKQQLAGEESITVTPKVVRQVVSKEVAERVTEMLVSVVDRSEGRPGGVPGYRIAGKTGTAQVARSDGAGYESDIYVASFVGYAPADAPKFLILVKLDLTPQTLPALRWGSMAAAPVFKAIAEELFRYYEIPPVGL